MDAYSEEIMGHQVGATLEAFYCITLRKALKKCDGRLADLTALIHHSDRGTQYASSKYVGILKERLIAISMTESGDPLENPIAERINGILKTEWIYDIKLKSWQETISFISRIIDLYNNQRPHQSISYMVPALVHQTNIITNRT